MKDFNNVKYEKPTNKLNLKNPFISIESIISKHLQRYKAKEIDFKQVDSTTYALYLNKDWKPLIKISKKAIQNNIDYYFLRMRLAIAYYEQKKYVRIRFCFVCSFDEGYPEDVS